MKGFMDHFSYLEYDKPGSNRFELEARLENSTRHGATSEPYARYYPAICDLLLQSTNGQEIGGRGDERSRIRWSYNL